jgi:hypothetical protein
MKGKDEVKHTLHTYYDDYISISYENYRKCAYLEANEFSHESQSIPIKIDEIKLLISMLQNIIDVMTAEKAQNPEGWE